MLKKLLSFLNLYSFKLLIFWVIILSFLYSSLSLIRHNHYQSGAFDLGIYDQAIWQYSRFQVPFNTVKERFILGDHLTLTLPIFAPLFYLWNNARILLIFQAIWMSVSAIPIFLFIKNRKFSPFSALLLSIMYSLFFGIQYAIYFDFHPVVIGAGILPWIFYFLETGKRKLLWISILFTLLTQENMGIALAGVGLCYILNKKYRRYAISFIVLGMLFSLIAAKLVALFSPVGYEYSPHISANIINIIRGFFDTHERQSVWFYSLSWFSFLPLLSPGAMLAVVLDLSQYFFLGREFSWMQGPFLHHRAILGVFLLIGTVQVLGFLRKKRFHITPIVIVIFVISLFLQFAFHYPINKLSKKEYINNPTYVHDINALLSKVPNNISIAAPQNLVPHLSHRNKIYLIWPRLHSIKSCSFDPCWWLDFSDKPKILVFSLDNSQWVTQLLESPQNFKEAVNNMTAANRIKIIKQIGNAYEYEVIY